MTDFGQILDDFRENGLTSDERSFANLSNEVYKGVDQRKDVKNYSHDDEFSGPRHSVYVREDGKPVIAFRGTKDRDDVLLDLDILRGKRNHPRLRESEELERRVRRKYGQAPILTGHSLGGYIANHVSMKNDNEAVVFNPGSNPFGQEKVSGRTKVIRKSSDFLSSGFGGPKKRPGVNLLGTLVHHSINRFV